MGKHTRHLYKEHQVEPNVIVECPDEYSMVAMVRENFGIALMPRTDILERAEGINIHKLENLTIYRQIFMFWMKERYRLPAVERFIQYMKDQAEEGIDSLSVSKI